MNLTEERLKALEYIKNQFGCDVAYYNVKLSLCFEMVQEAIMEADKIEKIREVLHK